MALHPTERRVQLCLEEDRKFQVLDLLLKYDNVLKLEPHINRVIQQPLLHMKAAKLTQAMAFRVLWVLLLLTHHRFTH